MTPFDILMRKEVRRMRRKRKEQKNVVPDGTLKKHIRPLTKIHEGPVLAKCDVCAECPRDTVKPTLCCSIPWV